MKIYVASSWRNGHQQRIVGILRKAGHEVYDFKHPTEDDAGFSWSEIDPNWQEWNFAEYIGALVHDKAKLGFNRDFDAMKAADVCILVLPCGRSAHLEAGWMKGAGKKVYAYIPSDYKMEPELMYKMLDGITNTTRGLLSFVIKKDHISYDKFREWCNMRACDGMWGVRQAMYAVDILEEMRHVSFWNRRRIWRERYEQQALSVIACAEAAQMPLYEEGGKQNPGGKLREANVQSDVQKNGHNLDNSTIGNTQRMREALEFVRDAHYVGEDNNGDEYECFNVECDDGTGRPLICVVEEALAAPPRNCDRFTDAGTAREAWLNDTENWDEFGSPKRELHEWLYAPATEKEGGR